MRVDKIVKNFGKAEFQLSECVGGYHIDRIFVPVNDRRNGFAKNGLKELVKFSEKKKKNLSTSIMPDEDEDYMYDALRKLFNQAGFVSEVINGEEYRNDLNYFHKNED